MLITEITRKKRTLKFLHDHHDDINDHDDHDNDQDDHDNDDIDDDCIYHLKRTINVFTIIMTITLMIENPEKVYKTFAQKCYCNSINVSLFAGLYCKLRQIK